MIRRGGAFTVFLRKSTRFLRRRRGGDPARQLRLGSVPPGWADCPPLWIAVGEGLHDVGERFLVVHEEINEFVVAEGRF
jgi:hypothetical protein